jgi:GrpB-like predicted nucleotidyltransferase (UPF0157 family)
MNEPAEIDEPVELAPYDEHWPAQFESEKSRIAVVLGASAVAIEHIGSTAVPGMTAKPVIDIQAGFEGKYQPEIWATALAPLGYESLGEAGVPGRWYFRKRSGARNFNLHAVCFGGAHWRNNLLIRDYLRLNPPCAAEYAAAKRRALEASRMLIGYSDAKSEFIAAMIRRAADYFSSTTIVR